MLEYKIIGDRLSYRWNNVVPGFEMPVKLISGAWITPTGNWKAVPATADVKKNGLTPDKNFYIKVNKAE